MESVKTKRRKDKAEAPLVERVLLKSGDVEKIESWAQQIIGHFEGLIRASKADILSSLIKAHSERLNVSELNAIAAELYDELQWAGRAVELVKQARREGRELKLDDLMAKRLPLERLKFSPERKQGLRRAAGNTEATQRAEQVDQALGSLESDG